MKGIKSINFMAVLRGKDRFCHRIVWVRKVQRLQEEFRQGGVKALNRTDMT